MLFKLWINTTTNATSIYNEDNKGSVTLWSMPSGLNTGRDDNHRNEASRRLFVDRRFWKIGCSMQNSPLFVGIGPAVSGMTIVPWGLGEIDLYNLPIGMSLSESVTGAVDLQEYFNAEVYPQYAD